MPTFIVLKFTATRLDSQEMVPHFSPQKDHQDTESATSFRGTLAAEPTYFKIITK
jgi:hypothetical protein